MVHLSIIIPAYNEEDRIGATLKKIAEFLKTKDYIFEVLVVDDGSSDKTEQIVLKSELHSSGRLRLIKNEINKGKGYSVKKGIINSFGNYVLFTDADLSTPIEEMDKLYGFIGKDYDIVIGSRALAGSDVKVRQPWHRETMGKTFNLFVKCLLMRDFNDTQCGFKLFREGAARDIAGLMKINGFAFDVEMLYIAKSKGYRIREVGVSWENSAESKVKLFHSPASMFLDLFKIKTLHKRIQT